MLISRNCSGSALVIVAYRAAPRPRPSFSVTGQQNVLRYQRATIIPGTAIYFPYLDVSSGPSSLQLCPRPGPLPKRTLVTVTCVVTPASANSSVLVLRFSV